MIFHSIGPTSHPSEPSRRPGGRSEEDAFMELHGGHGARLIYLTVEWLASRSDAAWRMASRPWKRRRPPCPSGCLGTDR